MLNRLITHGCSFTYGEELIDPKNQSWPAVLSRALNVELINLAKCAYSNDGIIHDIVTFDFKEGDLVIIGWTHTHRLMFVDNNGWYTTLPFYNNVSEYKHRETIAKLILETSSDKWLYERWLGQVLLLQHYFNSKKIPFLFFNVFNNFDNHHPLINLINKSTFVEWETFNFYEFSKGSLLPRNHPDINAHNALAQKLLIHYNGIK